METSPIISFVAFTLPRLVGTSLGRASLAARGREVQQYSATEGQLRPTSVVSSSPKVRQRPGATTFESFPMNKVA